MANLPDAWAGMSLGKRLQWARGHHHITLARMGEVAEISVERLRRLEGDRGKLAPDELPRLLHAYRLTAGQWLSGMNGNGAGALPPLLAGRVRLLTAGEVRALKRFIESLTKGRRRDDRP